MIGLLRRNRKPLIVTFVLVFLIGIFVGLGGYLFTGADTTESVAVVDGNNISYRRYRVRVNQYLDAMRAQDAEVTPEMTDKIKSEMLRDMIVNEMLAIKADEMGMRVSDTELALQIQQTPGFQREGRFIQALYFQMVRFQFKSTPEQYERYQRRDMLSAKMKALMFRNAKVVPSELKSEYLRLKAGPLKDYNEKSAAFVAQLRQNRALDTINFYLRQRARTADIRNFLAQRERGL